MWKEILENVRARAPLVHNITNYVTVNDCANILLASGASPIMADDEQEVQEITSICGGLNINIGTLNSRTIPSMFAAGKQANALGHPVVLDPVGVGASGLRTQTAQALLSKVKFTVIRGNSSEIKTLALGAGTTHGVDADTYIGLSYGLHVDHVRQVADIGQDIVVKSCRRSGCGDGQPCVLGPLTKQYTFCQPINDGAKHDLEMFCQRALTHDSLAHAFVDQGLRTRAHLQQDIGVPSLDEAGYPLALRDQQLEGRNGKRTVQACIELVDVGLCYLLDRAIGLGQKHAERIFRRRQGCHQQFFEDLILAAEVRIDP